MIMYDWGSFDEQFVENCMFWHDQLDQINVEFEGITGSQRLMFVIISGVHYELENLGDGTYSVNGENGIFTGEELYQYLKALSKGCNLNVIKLKIRSISNRFKRLADVIRLTI